MADHANMRLGKKAALTPAHLPTLSRYAVSAPLPRPPAKVDWSNGVPWPIFANDQVGDCVIAAMMHAVAAAQRWSEGAAVVQPDKIALANYTAFGKYLPGHPETDNGLVIAEAMDDWRVNGLTTEQGLNRARGVARIERLTQLKSALWLFGPLLLGLQMPASAQSQDVWTKPDNLEGDNAPGSWGGHCVLLVGLDADGTASLVTWGAVKRAEAGWLTAYLDEAWIAVQAAWVESGTTPCGVLADHIVADMGGF